MNIVNPRESVEQLTHLNPFVGKLRLRKGRYTPGEIDRAWSEVIEADFQEWLKARRSGASQTLVREVQ